MYSEGSNGFGLAFLVVMASSVGGEASDYWRVVRKEARATSNDSVNGMVVKSLAYILGFGFLI